MFTGKYSNSIDEKGRVVIPAKLRYSLGERVWLVNGADGCLNIFTQPGWIEYTTAYITNRTMKDELSRQLQRFILGGAQELDIDKQGRINLPQEMIDHAGIEKEVVFIGVGGVVELWSAETLRRAMGPDSFDPKLAMAKAAETGE